MKLPSFIRKKNFLLVLAGIVIFGGYVAGLWNGVLVPPNQNTNSVQSSSFQFSESSQSELADRIEVIGETTCLPKKGPGPHTMECAIGIHADDTGLYYALNLMVLQTQAGFGLDTGEHIRVEGTLIDPATLDTDQWDSYDIAGVIVVASLVQGTD